MATSISLARIRTLGIPISWHEAVAVAQNIGTAAQVSEVALGLDNCLLSASGLIEVAGTSKAPFAGDPVTSTLGALLDRAQAPRELVALVQNPAGAGSAERSTASELEFFARPDGAAALVALATRALAAASLVQQEDELERLRAHVGMAPSAPEKKRTLPRPNGRFVATALALLLLAGVLTLAATRLRTAIPTGDDAGQQGSPAQAIAQRLEVLVDKGLATLGLAPADGTPAANEPAAITPETRSPHRTATRTKRPAVPTTSMFVVLVPPAIEPSPDAQDVASAVDAEPAVARDDDQDLSSRPPVLRWPQLPEDPGSMPVDTSAPYLELQVNEEGTVDKVRLRSRNSAFHERMLVSAAKAWVFHPAQQDGRPVKYVLKVPILGQ